MNTISLIGRITKDIEVRHSNSGTAIIKFFLAVNRQFKKDNEERQADFISCVAFGHTANHIAKYFSKGSMIAVTGRLKTGSYEKEGIKHYTSDVIIDSCYFCGSKQTEKNNENDVENNMQSKDDELPF